MFDDEALLPLVDQLASSDSPEPASLTAAPPTPPDETNEQRARRIAKKRKVDPNLVVSLMSQESRGKTKARSWADARGPMQLMPDTARKLGVTDIYDPEQNIDAGVRYLRSLIDRFGDDEQGLKKSIAAYNLGPDSKILQSKDWWNKLQYASNDKEVQQGRKPRGPSDKTNTQNYVKNIWSNYVRGGAPTVMNYEISEDTAKLAKRLFGSPSKQTAAKAAKLIPESGTKSTDAYAAKDRPLLDPAELTKPDPLAISPETTQLAETLFGGKGTVSAGAELPADKVPTVKEPTLSEVNKALKAEGKKPITQEQLAKQAKENESFGSDVTVGYAGGVPVDDSGQALPVPIDGPISVRTDEDILAKGTRTIKMDPDTPADQAFDKALHSVGAEYGLPTSQVEGFIAKRRAEGKTLQYDLTPDERAALKASGKQMGVTVDYLTLNNLLQFGQDKSSGLDPRLRQTVDMYTAQNRQPRMDLTPAQPIEPKGFIDKFRGISPLQEQQEKQLREYREMSSDPLYLDAFHQVTGEEYNEKAETLASIKPEDYLSEYSPETLAAVAEKYKELSREKDDLAAGMTGPASRGAWVQNIAKQADMVLRYGADSSSVGPVQTAAGAIGGFVEQANRKVSNLVGVGLRALGQRDSAAGNWLRENTIAGEVFSKNAAPNTTAGRIAHGLGSMAVDLPLMMLTMRAGARVGMTGAPNMVVGFALPATVDAYGAGHKGSDIESTATSSGVQALIFHGGGALNRIVREKLVQSALTQEARSAIVSGRMSLSDRATTLINLYGQAAEAATVAGSTLATTYMSGSETPGEDAAVMSAIDVIMRLVGMSPGGKPDFSKGLGKIIKVDGKKPVYLTFSPDGKKIIQLEKAPPMADVVITEAGTLSSKQIQDSARTQMANLTEPAVQAAQRGRERLTEPVDSEPVRSVVPVPRSEPMVVNAEPIAPIVMGRPKPPVVEPVSNSLEADGDRYFDPAVIKSAEDQTAGSREKVIRMPIDEFLSMAEGLDAPVPEKAAKVAGLIDDGTPFNELPSLNVNRDGNVTDHNGRHRALALKAAGVKTIPVVLRSENIRWGSQEPGHRDRVESFPAELISQDGKAKVPFPVTQEAGPIPESQTAIDAQTAAAADPSQTKRIAVMFPKGTEVQFDSKTQWKIVNSKGDVVVVDKEGWKQKAAELGVKPTKSALVEYTKAGKNETAVQDLLGRPESAVVESTEATPGRAAVEATQGGKQIDATVVDTAEAMQDTVDSMEQQYPDAEVEVKESTEVAQNRIADTELSSVERFEQQAGRSATMEELAQILNGKTPEEILKVNQEPAKDTVEPESKPKEDPYIKMLKDGIDHDESSIINLNDEIKISKSNLDEARSERDAAKKKVKASKLSKEEKADAIEEIEGKYQDAKDDIESEIDGYKEDIAAHKADLKAGKRDLQKYQSSTPDPEQVAFSESLKADEAIPQEPMSEEPHVGMLQAGVEVQLEPYVRPAMKDGEPLLRDGQPMLEGSLVQTKLSNGTSSYIGDRILGTDRADMLRQLDKKRLEYQAEHGQEGTFMPKSEVVEPVKPEPARDFVEGDDVMTPDGPGEFIRSEGKKTMIVEIDGEEKPFLKSLVKPMGSGISAGAVVYNRSGLEGEVVGVKDGKLTVQWRDQNGNNLGRPVPVAETAVLSDKPEVKVTPDDDLVEMGVGINPLKKLLGLRTRNDSINTVATLAADAEAAAVREAMAKSNGLDQSTLLGRMREHAIGMYNGFKRTFINIDPNKSPEMAVSNDILRQQLAAPKAAEGLVTMAIGQITKNLGPQRLQLFTENLVLNDLAKDVEAGKYLNKPLPFELTTEVLERMLAENEALVAINPEIRDAIERRQVYVDGITNQLVAYDLLGPEVLSDPRYFHRQVLEYMNEKTYTGTNMSGDLRDRTKGFQMGRTGSSRDYNTNYAEAEFEWLSQAQALILRRQGRDRLQQVNDLKPALELGARVESEARGAPVSFREFIPDTHTLWQPKKGNFFYESFPMAERMLNRLVDGEAELTEIQGDYYLEYENSAGEPVSSKVSPRQILGGRRPEWVIPKELAAELDNFNAIDTLNPMENFWTSGQNGWKQWTLLNPAKALVYNLNNMSGDLDITLAYDPSILKYFPTAAKDAWNFNVRGNSDASDIARALELGVIDSGLTVAEIPDIQTQTAFKGLSNNDSAGLMKAVGTFWDTTKNLTNGRENILRLAAFRYFKDKLAAGENVYGASNAEQIVAIRESEGDEVAAAKLARELVGDYGAVSKSGQWIRRHMIPFYSWIEINAPRYVRMLRNTTKEDGAAAGYGRYARAAGVGAAKTALGVTKLAVKASLFSAAASMYNRTAFPEEDKELRRQGDRNYIILGRRPDGSIRSLKLAGAMKDLLEWAGLEDLPRDIDEMAAGDRTIKDELIEVPKSAINKVVQSLEPFTKTTYEMIMGQQVYPTIFPPKSEIGLVTRPIRDRSAHLARTLSSKALYDAGYYVYAKLTGRPEMPARPWTAGDALGKVLDATIAYRMDPNETMFWAVKGDSIDWAKKNGKEMPAMDPTEKSNALFYYKQGLKIGDEKAAEQWRQEYFRLGGDEDGLKMSIERAHPLASLSNKQEQLAYVKQLSPEKTQQLKQALAYYNGIYLIGGEGTDKTADELYDKLLIQLEGASVSATRQKEEKESLESRVASALIARAAGNSTLFNQLPTAERNKILLKENTTDEMEDFSRTDVTEKLYVFKHSSVEDQAAMMPFIRKATGQLYNQSLPAKRRGQSKKPLSREDQVLLREMQAALKQYEGSKAGLPADVVQKLKEAELTSTKALPPVKPKAQKRHR